MFTVTQMFVGLSILALSHISTGLNIDSELVTHSQTPCKSHYNGTILHHPTDCHKFFVCVNSQPQEYNCESNFHFDRNSRSCMAGNKCENSNEIHAPPFCQEGAVNAVTDNCFMFDTCVNGQYQRLNCPGGFFFYAPHAVCRPITNNAHFKCNCVVPEHTVLQNKDHCQTFYVCKGGKALLHKCDEGQYYESAVNTCLRDIEGVCVMKPTKTPPKAYAEKDPEISIETPATTLCERNVRGVISFTAFEGNCNKFQMCLNGQLYTKECPMGLYYDDSKKYCVVDTDNICQNGMIIEATQNSMESEDLNSENTQNSKDLKKQTKLMPPTLAQAHDNVFSKLIKL